LLEAKFRRQIADKPKPRLLLNYESADGDHSDAGNAIAASLGDFTEAKLLFLFCVAGDGCSRVNEGPWTTIAPSEWPLPPMPSVALGWGLRLQKHESLLKRLQARGTL